MISQILIPTDFSPAAWQATKIGVELAKVNKASVSMLHIIPTSSRFSQNQSVRHLPEKQEKIRTQMQEMSHDYALGKDMHIENHVIPGNVEETMMQFIRENAFDLVIIGVNSHGSTNDLGSHAAFVIEKCEVPVLTVPNKIQSRGAIAS